MGETKLRKMLETRLLSGGHKSMGSVPVAELEELTLLGSGTLPKDEAVGLTGGEAIRAINQPNVHHIAKQLVAKGFNPEFPLTVGILPVKNSSEKEFRATLTGGGHRLAAILSCDADFARYLAGEETLYDWSGSPFSESKPPEWLREVPARLHFYGGVEAFLKVSVAVGHAQNNVKKGSAPTTYYDKIFYIRGMREQGWNQAEIIAHFPPSVKENHQKKLLGTCTALCSGLFPAVDVLAEYYKTFFEHSMVEFFAADRFSTAPAKATRKVFMEGKHTGNNANRFYGLRVFATLSLKYQAMAVDGGEPSLREGMANRVHNDGPLARFAGPYARLLEETLGVVVTAVTERHLREVLHLRTKPARSDDEPANAGITKSMPPLDLGLTVISKLLADHTFLPPHSGAAVPGADFPVPEGEALQKPVCDAICSLVDHPVSADAVQRCLYMSAESVTGTDDEEEEEAEEEEEEEEKEEASGKGCDDRATTSKRSSDASGSRKGGGDNSEPVESENDASNAVYEMETAPENEDARDTETTREGSRAPATLCYTGLSRMVGEAVPNVLKSADAEDVRIHTIFVYEDDPKLGKVAAQLEALHASGSLHATPVVVAVPCAEAYVGAGGKTTSPLDSEDDAAETDFKFRMTSLQTRMEEWLGKACQSLTILAHVSDSTPASTLNRGKAANAMSGVDSAVNGSWKQPIMVFAFRDAPLQKLISPGDAAGPWSKDDSGYSFTLQGKEITSFSASDARTRDLQRMAMRYRGSRYDPGLNTTMSPEVYKSLLRIFHVEGSAVLSTYDPCGVVQAAAVTLRRHCLTFLGRSTKTALQSIDIDDVPLLGSRSVGARNLRRVVGDHKGNVLTESGAGTTGKPKGPGSGKTGGATGKSKGSGARETGGATARRDGSAARETGGATGKRKVSAAKATGGTSGKKKGSGTRETEGTSGKRKAAGTKETVGTAGKPKGSEARETRGSTGGGTGKQRSSGAREAAGAPPARSDGDAKLKAPLKRPGSSCSSPSDDQSVSSRKRPNIGDAGSSSARPPMDEESSETAVP